MAAHQLGAKKVLFLTVKKAIPGIQSDVKTFGKLEVDTLSLDSANKVDPSHDYDLIVIDEAHGLGAFPKPNKRARNYVDIKQRLRNGKPYNDYTKARKEKIQPFIDKYFISFTQKEAGFKCDITEHDIIVPLKPMTKKIIKLLKDDKVVEGQSGVILAETAVKMLSKQHQLSSGTVILEEGAGTVIIDRSKIKYIRENFPDNKLAIFYKYKAELAMIKGEFGEKITTDVEEFQQSDKHIAIQIRAGSMGINLSAADCQVYVSVDFSAKDYIQSRARLQKQNRKKVDVHFLVSNCGVDRMVLKTVRSKMEFTSSYFKPLFNEP